MVLDFNSFFKQRGPRSRVGNFGVNDLTPQAGAGAQPQPQMPAGWSYSNTPGSWDMAGQGDTMSYARSAMPDPQGRLPGQPGYGTSAPGTGANPTGAGMAPPPVPGVPPPGAPPGAGSPLAQGAGGATVPQGGPAWAAYTAGFTGSTYAGLAGKFDPWGSWGRYGPNINAPKIHQTGNGTMESDVDRVYRWTNDILRNQYHLAGGEAADPALRTQIFLANVERLKSEYAHADPPIDWNSSAFANMDRQMAAATPPVAPPVTPPVAANGGGGGAPPATTPVANAGGNGGPATDDQLDFMLHDPNAAFRYMMRQRGYSNLDSGGYASQFLENRYTPALQALAQMAGHVGGPDELATQDYGNILNQIVASGGQRGGTGLSGLTRQMARTAYDNVSGPDGYLAGAGDEAGQAFDENVNYLNTFGGSTLMQRAEQNRLKRAMNQYGDVAFDTIGGDTSGPQTWAEFKRQRGYRMYR